jgi:Kef-type K+ transport system membrane component KefB
MINRGVCRRAGHVPNSLAFVIQHQLSMLYKLLIPVFFCAMGMLIDFTRSPSHRS